jgi:hypothetical protein
VGRYYRYRRKSISVRDHVDAAGTFRINDN